MRPRYDEQRDDVDRIFAQLRSVPPPPDLARNILASLPAEQPTARIAPTPATIRRRWGWVSVAAAVLLVVFSVRLGSQMVDSGAFGVLGEIFADLGGFFSAPGEYLGALAAGLPWGDLILALLALGLFWFSGGTASGRGPISRQG